MNKRNTVFVGISLIYVQDIFNDVEVATTLKGLCRVIKVKYEATAKAWKRKGSDIEIDVMTGNGSRWRIVEKDVDTVWGRGGVENFKKNNGGFRGFKGDDGRLAEKPAKDRMGFNEVINTWKEGDEE